MPTDDLDRQLAEMAGIVSGVAARTLTALDLLRWSGSIKDFAYFNAVSLRLAQRFDAGDMDYTVCDAIMNDLWGIFLSAFDGGSVPSPFYEIYEAFDAGEYHREPDGSDDPIADHTRPLIREILAEFAGSE